MSTSYGPTINGSLIFCEGKDRSVVAINCYLLLLEYCTPVLGSRSTHVNGLYRLKLASHLVDRDTLSDVSWQRLEWIASPIPRQWIRTIVFIYVDTQVIRSIQRCAIEQQVHLQSTHSLYALPDDGTCDSLETSLDKIWNLSWSKALCNYHVELWQTSLVGCTCQT